MSSVKAFPVRAGILLVVLAFAACQPLPQPFRPASKGPAANVLIQPIGEASVFIPPVTGLPADQGAMMAAELATVLGNREIPATAGARNLLSADLIVTIEPSAAGPVWRWRLDRDGRTDKSGPPLPLRRALPLAAAGNPADRRQLAEAMAATIVPALLPDLPAAMVDPASQRLGVLDCDGAPGDGNRALRQAMRELLILSNRPPVADPASADYLVSCNIRVWADGPDSERVTIEWALLAADGTRLGEVKQANRIPKGQLAGAWGQTAHIIAQGGWQGLREILESRPAAAAPAGPAAERSNNPTRP
ncbi:hypothetical protein [Ferrovibrio sp.]|uniref:hypothetical protein n=1 Tax=Ferrovibrio sp. TaxID=1917215 RepID=UPI003517D6D2